MIRANTDKGRKSEIMKRLAILLVAVVFVFGTAFVPSQVYAVEPEDQNAAAIEAAEPETTAEEVVGTDEAAGETAAGEAEAEEVVPEAAETEAPASDDTESADADLSDLIVITDENGNSMDLEDLDESMYDGFIYKLEDGTTKTEVREMKEAIDDLDADQEVDEVIKNEMYTADSIETIREVVEPEKIEYIEPDYVLHASYVPSDPEYNTTYSWQLENTNVPDVWDMGLFGDGAIVAVLDSGVNINHPDLNSERFLTAYKYNAFTGTNDVTDNYGHGTKVTGLIAEQHNDIGFAGAMPNVSILPVKVLSDSGLTGESTLIKGINYVAGKKINNRYVDVINMSLGGDFNGVKPTAMEDACREAAAKGIILVAAAGNEANSYSGGLPEYPASYDSVVSVGSVNKNNKRSSSSNYNDKLAVVAPGENVCVIKGSSYGNGSGTSYATPQVSALAAMVKAYNHNISPAQFMEMLKATSNDLGAAGYDEEYGYGIIDFHKAYGYITTDLSYKDLTLSGTTYVYDGGVKTPSASVSVGSEVLANGTDFTVSYSSGRTAVGTYKVTATGIGNYTGTKTASFTIIPPLVKGIKAPKRQKKKLTVRWSAMSKSQQKKFSSAITGYQVRVSTKSSFTGAKYAKVKGATKTTVTVKGLKKKTNYYVQYRSYKTVGSATYYSKWSGVKKAKTK